MRDTHEFNDVKDVAKLLKDNDNYLLCPHINPDPDALGSAVGLYLALKKLGKKVRMYLPESTPPYMDYLLQYADISLEQPLDEDLKMIFLDLGTPKQLHPNVKLVNAWLDIDHHLAPVDFSQYAYIDQTSPATAEIVVRIIKALNCPFDATIATCLYSGIVFDTNNYTSSSTDPKTLELGAELLGYGANPNDVYQRLNQQNPLNFIKLMGEVLQNISTTLDDNLAWAVLTQEMLERYQLDETECDPIITQMVTIATAEVIILFKESPNGYVKISWRSKGQVDVNRIARSLGGGGHRLSCGARLELPLKQAIEKVITTTTTEMQQELAVA